MLLEPEIERVGDAFGNRIKFHSSRDFAHARVCVESVFETTKRSSDFRFV
jgi:hypothetical protein